MARKQPSAIFRFKDAVSVWLGDRVASISDSTRRLLWQGVGITVVATLLFFFGSRAMQRMQEFVHGQDQYDRPLVLEWENLPDWLMLPDNGHILDDLVARVDLQPTDRMLDPELSHRIGSALTTSDVGWVKAVDRIQIRAEGVIGIRCQFRKPNAWVKQGSSCYLVDDECYRLPGRYAADDCKGSSLMTIIGVRGKAPGVGQRWPASELADGIRTVALLSAKPFGREISAVNVSNHDGRVDKNRPHIELITDAKGSRIWWGRPPEREQGIEISATQKVTLLETLYKQWGRLSVNRPYIDIRTWPDRVAMPMMIPTSSQTRVIRG